MKIAVIGSGISGMVSAYKLSSKNDVTVYEKNSYIGGHTNTIDVNNGVANIPVDTGFIVFNKKTYPNFVKLMESLGVAYQKTSMSFSVRCQSTGLEYNGTDFNRLFAQRSNLFKPSFYKFIAGIAAFNGKAKQFLQSDQPEITLREFVKREGIAEKVVSHYLIPMAAAVWSADPEQMWEFPASFIIP